MNRRIKALLGWTTVLVFFLFCLVYGFIHLSPWVAAWDEVDFTLALDRFDLLAMQPHAPGYPYFILGGRLLQGFVSHPSQSLGLWNLLLTASAAWPVYALGRRWLGQPQAVLCTLLVLLLPMNATLAVRPMSEGAALALLWWSLWTLVRATERLTVFRWIAAAFVFGWLLGTRLSYVPFGLGLAWLWFLGMLQARQQGLSVWRRGIGWAAIVAFFQLLWVAGMAAAEGGWTGMWSLTDAFVKGHFDQWGGGIVAAPMPFGQRVLQFVGDNLLWTGSYARQYVLLGVSAAAIGSVVVLRGLDREEGRGEGRSWPDSQSEASPAKREISRRVGRLAFLKQPTPSFLLLAAALAYALWALLGQNIAKPRHAAPLAALAAFGMAVQLLRPIAATRLRAAWSRTAVAMAVLLAGAQTVYAAQLVALQDRERPAIYQLADTLAGQQLTHTVLYTWEEERVLRYLQSPIQTRPIFTYAYFKSDLAAAPSERILLTGSVLEGFRQQGAPDEFPVRLLGVYHSDERLDPVYGTIALYEWIR